MLKANSVLRAKNKANPDQVMVIWTNEIPTILHLFWAKRETTGETSQYWRKTKIQLKLVKWSKKNANSRSHLRKINEKRGQKLGRQT